MQKKTIDVVIPAYNEEAGIARTIEKLFAQVARLPYRFELIVVDDGSSDRTVAVVREHMVRFPITLVALTRNFGKEAALLAGLDHARGDATILMDADLQHPVELIERFLAEWEAGYECVYAVKEHRRGESWLKRVLTKAFYLGLNGGSKLKIVPNALDFRLLDRVAVRALCAIRERVRFTKGLYAWLGLRSVGIPLAPPERIAGSTRFDRRALLRLGWDGLTSFSDLPLRASAIVGGSVAVAAVVYGLYVVARTLVFGIDVPGWATLTVAVTFLSGLQILFLGVLGQYVRNVFIETKQRPNYLLREVAGLGAHRLYAPATDTAPRADGDPVPPLHDHRQSGRVAAA
jgi:glycosyltransferase involved in cell wall biosynthesis